MPPGLKGSKPSGPQEGATGRTGPGRPEGAGHHTHADHPRCKVVSRDAARIEGIEAFRTPRRRHWLDVTGQAIGVGHPHSRAEKSRKVKGTEAEAEQAGEEQVNAKHFWQVEGWFTGARVSEKF